MEKPSSFSQESLQRWMQAFLVQPADAALREQHGNISAEDIEQVIAPSKRMSARQRLAIYQRGYYARLQECMGKQFSVLKYALGEALFRDFAFEYLKLYPSESYTLGNLGERFPAFLESTRPDRDAPPEERESWPDFMIELARLEWSCFKLMEADGHSKGRAILQSEEGDLAFYLPSALQLFQLQFPSYAYYQAVLKGEDVGFPETQNNHLLLVKRKHRIGAFALNSEEYQLWSALVVGQSLAQISTDRPAIDLSAFLEKWRRWKLLGLET